MGSDPDSGAVVFLLGAGASVDAGCLTVKQLTDQFAAWEAQGGRPVRHHLAAYKWLLEQLGAMPAVTEGLRQVDIELVLEALERIAGRESDPLAGLVRSDGWAKGMLKHEPWFNGLGLHIRDYIREKCELEPDRVRYLRPLVEYALSVPGGLDVFTLNYDSGIELACEDQRVPYTDGFALTWDPAQFDDPRYRLRLHKLHGSLLWYETGDDRRLVRIPITHERGQSIRFLGARKVTQVQVYPTAPKEQHVEPYSTLMARFRQRLRKARVLVSIGCSFRDHYIKEIVAEALHQNQGLRLVVVDPYPYEVLQGSDQAVPKALAFQSVASQTHLVVHGAAQALDGGWLMHRLRNLREVDEKGAGYRTGRLEATGDEKAESIEAVVVAAIYAGDIGELSRLFTGDDAALARSSTLCKAALKSPHLLGAALAAVSSAPSEGKQIAEFVGGRLVALASNAAYEDGAIRWLGDQEKCADQEDVRELFGASASRTRSVKLALERLWPALKWHCHGRVRICEAILRDLDALAAFYEAAGDKPKYNSITTFHAKQRSAWSSEDVAPMRALASRIEGTELRSVRALREWVERAQNRHRD